MHILVVNAGSSTLRYALLETDGFEPVVSETVETGGDTRDALRRMLERLHGCPAPAAIGHRVVHGGPSLTRPVTVDDGVVAAIEAASRYAPLQNPANLEAIRACRSAWPVAAHVAVFETGFHATLPDRARDYALPADLVDRYGLRRFGFHGISHEQLMLDAAAFLGRPPDALNLITLHLGNGASATAIRSGQSVDTSMGMTPAEGLVMGTRSGDLDPGLLAYVARADGLDGAGLDALVNRRSGLFGLCGDADMREVRSRALSGDSAAERAIDIYVYRIRKYVGAFQAVLGRVDALVFSGGVGENHPWLLQAVCEDLAGIRIDPAAADRPTLPTNLAATDSDTDVLVIAADETRSIVRQVLELLDAERYRSGNL